LGSQDPAKFVLALRDELYRKLSEVNLRLK